MKASEFLKIYRALVNLYGAILTDDAFVVLKKYYPNPLKKELYKDLNTRLGKFTKFYSVYKTADHNYLICDNFMSFEDVDYLFALQRDKPRYIPETLDEFLLYSEPTYVEENEQFKNMEKYMMENFNFSEIEAYIETKLIAARIKCGLRMQDSINSIEEKYVFKDENDLFAFTKIYQDLNNNIRVQVNLGYTPNEIYELKTFEKTVDGVH